MNKLLNILLQRYCTFYITNQQINYSLCISFKKTLFLTIFTFSFRIRMSVTLTYVSVSLARCTLNGATILSDDEPDSQNLDYKDILHSYFILQITNQYQTVKHNKQYRILNPCQQTLYKHHLYTQKYVFLVLLKAITSIINIIFNTNRFNLRQWIHTYNCI